jgi:hypothetical protein
MTTSPIPGETPVAEPRPIAEPAPVRSRLSEAARAMTRVEQNAVLPDGVEEPSSKRLRVVTGYFQAVAILSVLRLVVLASLLLSGSNLIPGVSNLRLMPLLLSGILTSIGYFWTARELRNRSQRAWVPAILVFAVPIVAALFGVNVPVSSLVIAVAGVLTLFSVRKELD